jgi:hypothetical protein
LVCNSQKQSTGLQAYADEIREEYIPLQQQKEFEEDYEDDDGRWDAYV